MSLESANNGPTTFPDDELQRLKVWVTDNPHEDDDGLSIRGTKRLLKRLEAAEQVACKVFRLRQILYGLCLDLRQAMLVQKFIDEVKDADADWRKITGSKR